MRITVYLLGSLIKPKCMQTEAVEALIQDLPKFRLKAVPTDCSECPICLEEFHVGNEVIISLVQHVMSE